MSHVRTIQIRSLPSKLQEHFNHELPEGEAQVRFPEGQEATK